MGWRWIPGITSTTGSTGSSSIGDEDLSQMRTRGKGVFFAVLALLLPSPGASQASGHPGEGDVVVTTPVDPEALPRPTARAARITGSIIVDGILDEEAWKDAEPITGFIQSMPDAGAPATEETVVKVLYDDERIYFGALMLDSEPQGIIHQFLEQDFETHDDDVFAVALDTFLDRRDSFMFLINPNGAVKDGQTFDNSRTTNLAWEGVIEVETTIHEEGWTVELAIPFTTLRFDPRENEQSWGMNFLRRIRRKNEDSYWAPVDRRTRVHTMAYAGTVSGFSGLPRPRNVSIKPFGLASNASGTLLDPLDEGAKSDFGMDLKWGVTPRLTLDLTYRTDFSQVEVDQEQVNLTRFSLFFPEKRDFFMENEGIFAFGDLAERNVRLGASPRDFTLFHSRRIGLSAGRPVPIEVGGRLTGRAGGFDVGLINMRTESAEGLPSESFTVARVRRSFFGGVQLGGLFATRDALGVGEDLYNRSYGADLNITLGGNLFIHSYIAAVNFPGVEGNNRAARISAAFRDRLWDVSALYREIGDAFDPGLGFVARGGIRHSYGTVGMHPRPDIPGVNEINPYVEIHYITDLQSVLETREGNAGLGVLFSDGGELRTQVSDRFEAVDEPFSVAGRGEVLAGRYDFVDASLSYASNAARRLSGEVQLSGGGYFDGSRTSLTLSGAWRPSRHFAVDLQAQRNAISLPGNDFTADVFGTRLDFAGSRRLFLSSFLQYNAASEEIVTNIRLNFIHSPLSDLFLVYSERRAADRRVVLERGVTLKVTKLFSF
jgi:hypothetical protein